MFQQTSSDSSGNPPAPRQSRRSFLATSGAATAGVAGVFAAQLAGIRQSVAAVSQQVESVSEDRFATLAKQYSVADSVNYLNHAAIGTIPRPVQAAFQQYVELCESNPWLHIWGDAWDEPLAHTRELAAEALGCRSSDVAITHNTTEMFNTLALGLPLKADDEVLFSTLNHAGASLPFTERAKLGKFRVRRFAFPTDSLPGITADEIVAAHAAEISPRTRLLVFPHIDNTVGIRHPVKEIADMARERGVEFIAVDAAQTAGMLKLDSAAMNVDVLATSGHKWLGGPKGTGLAYVNGRIHDTLQPLSVTWGQAQWSGSARRYEDYGTRNMPDVLALDDAMTFLQKLTWRQREDRLRDLWSFTQGLVEQADSLSWTSPDDWKLAGSLYSIRVSRPAGALSRKLFNERGIVVRPFSNLGLNNLRVSPNVFTSKSEIEEFIRAVA
ncbi:MAG: aminotransferase class V-fold PLP-dependent enzyme [Pirellulales bacterium]|nr:aminotransferase class V-fold PLP-dependent enzyme [Pirellulales bacterium]